MRANNNRNNTNELQCNEGRCGNNENPNRKTNILMMMQKGNKVRKIIQFNQREKHKLTNIDNKKRSDSLS